MPLKIDPWHAPDAGTLFVVSGASGTGKTTLVRAALERIPGIEFSVSATTRPPRSGEIDGKHYHFLSDADFEAQVQNNEFLEWANVFGKRYGTLAGPVRGALNDGRSVLLEIDVQGAHQVRQHMPEAVTIFVLPPSIAALEKRLVERKSDAPDVIARRLSEARAEIERCGEFDYLVINDDLETAHDVFQAVVVAALRRTVGHASTVERFGRHS